MKMVDGWWCVDEMNSAGTHLGRAKEFMTKLGEVSRGVVVQAGGHIGTYPKTLAMEFKRVYTFEPEWHNWQCLTRNTSGLSNVYPARAVLGNVRGPVGLTLARRNTGKHCVDFDGSDVLSFRLDDLALRSCALLALDVEGMELSVLEGAERTVDRLRPWICTEDNGLSARFGDDSEGLKEWMERHNYEFAEAWGEDKLWRPR